MANKLAFVFPGQGSQTVGMLSALAADYSVVKSSFDEASEVLGFDTWKLAEEGPEEQLNLTEYTQPMMLIAGVAVWRVWCETGGQQPDLMAGHSLGEYTALVCAGAMSLTDGAALVRKRGELMRDAVPNGAGKMAAILGMEDAAVRDVCAQAQQDQCVQAVNYNSPGQVVIAGNNTAVDRAIELAVEAGARKAMALPVSVPCHSDLMRPASEELAKAIDALAFKVPAVSIVNNIAAEITDDVESIKQNLITQLYSPVLWVDIINRLAAEGVDTVIECGPGKVLSGLNKRIQRGLTVGSIQDPAALKKMLAL